MFCIKKPGDNGRSEWHVVAEIDFETTHTANISKNNYCKTPAHTNDNIAHNVFEQYHLLLYAAAYHKALSSKKDASY